MKYETTFAVGDKVEIVELERIKAVVRQVCISETGVTYQIFWFNEGQRHEGWVFGDEIAAVRR